MSQTSGRIESAEAAPQRPGIVGWLSDLLRLGDGRFRELVQALPTALFTTDATGRITFYNEAAAALWGSRPELGDAQGCWDSWKQYWPDGTAITRADSPIAVALEKDQLIRDVEVITERPDGTRVSLLIYSTPLRDASGDVVGTVNMLVDISDRRRAEEQQKLILNESMHRIRNTLATVQALAMQTLRRTPKYERNAFIARLHSLGNAHDLLTNDNWDRAPLRDVLERALVPFGKERFLIEGPATWLNANNSLRLTMVLHELATNAAKYGALSMASGQVRIAWELPEPGRLKFRWQERHGPKVSAPERKGFGSLLIEQSFKEAHFEFAPQGLTCTWQISIYNSA